MERWSLRWCDGIIHLRRLEVLSEEEVESVVEERAAVNALRQQRGEVELEIVPFQ